MPELLDSEIRELESRVLACSTHAFQAANALLQNRADAEDIAQEALIKAYRSLSQLQQVDRVHSWVARIAWRLALNKLRADRYRHRREEMIVRDRPYARTTNDPAVMNDNYRRLCRAIDGLPPHFRAVTLLVGIEEYSVRDIAQRLNLPEGTVKSRLHRARRMLRSVLR